MTVCNTYRDETRKGATRLNLSLLFTSNAHFSRTLHARLWTGSLVGDGAKKTKGKNERTLGSLRSLIYFRAFSPLRSLFTGYLQFMNSRRVWNCLACVINLLGGLFRALVAVSPFASADWNSLDNGWASQLLALISSSFLVRSHGVSWLVSTHGISSFESGHTTLGVSHRNVAPLALSFLGIDSPPTLPNI